MKILHIINNLGSGGAEKLLVNYLRFDKSKFEHFIYLLSDKNNVYLEELKQLNITLKISNRKSIYSPLHIKDIIKYIKKIDANVVHSHLFPSFYWVGLVSKKVKGPKYIVTEHGSTNHRRRMIFIRSLEMYIYSSFDNIICISKSVFSSLDDWLKFKFSNKMLIVLNGIKLNNSSKKKKSSNKYDFDLQDNDFVIAMIARFTEEKNHKILIKALRKTSIPFKLLLVGEGKLRQKIERLVSINKLETKILFTGFIKDVENIYSIADLIVMPSKHEGFGITAIEAMSFGIPLIVSNISSLKEITADGAITFKSGNSSSLAEKIDLVFYSKPNKNLTIRSIKQAQKYSIENTISRINQIYSK